VPRRATTDPLEEAVRAFLVPRGFDAEVTAIAYQLYRASQEAIARAEAEVLRPRGLSWTGYTILMAVWMLGPTEVRELARLQPTSKAGVVKALDALEARGLVRRTRSDVDRRLVSVALTRAGRARIPRLQHAVHAREHRLTGALTGAEKRALVRLLRKLDTRPTDGSLTG
jgi:DNA-binding MarR family transcriptional regulator